MKSFYGLLLLLFLFGCGNEKLTQVANEALLKENAELKAKIKYQERQKNERVKEENLRESIIGFWFVPHAATVNIRFDRKGTFIFNDYNTNLEKMEKLTGTYDLSGKILTLYYEDRPKQNFRYRKEVKGDDQYYISKKGYWFVKGENGYE